MFVGNIFCLHKTNDYVRMRVGEPTSWICKLPGRWGACTDIVPGNNLKQRDDAKKANSKLTNKMGRKGTQAFPWKKVRPWRAWTRHLVETSQKLEGEFGSRYNSRRLICFSNSTFFHQAVVLFHQYTTHFWKGGFTFMGMSVLFYRLCTLLGTGPVFHCLWTNRKQVI